jgi:hypothetical protein
MPRGRWEPKHFQGWVHSASNSALGIEVRKCISLRRLATVPKAGVHDPALPCARNFAKSRVATAARLSRAGSSRLNLNCRGRFWPPEAEVTPRSRPSRYRHAHPFASAAAVATDQMHDTALSAAPLHRRPSGLVGFSSDQGKRVKRTLGFSRKLLVSEPCYLSRSSMEWERKLDRRLPSLAPF